MTKKTVAEKYPLEGKVIQTEKDDVKSNEELLSERRLQVMADLDKIPYPIMCSVIMEPQAFDYRNKAFWDAIKKQDDSAKELLVDFINSKKK